MKILVSGATGTMGKETIKELLSEENFDVRILSLRNKSDIKTINKWKEKIEVHYGDLREYKDCLEGVRDIDIVLHIGAFVSPAADKQPLKAWDINYKGTKNLIDAIIELKQENHTKFVFIGSVAETGNRQKPYHWGRVGDPIIPSMYDYYAVSKVMAEKYVVESKLKYWVSLRQTGIIHKDILKHLNDGIEYHQPLDNHLEWVSAKDSARLMLNVCKKDHDIWNNIYNIGGGEDYRFISYDFINYIMGVVYNLKFEDLYDEEMYAKRNFHGQWFLDSDELNEKLHFRYQTFNNVVEEIKKNKTRLLKILPKRFLKRIIKRKQLHNNNTPMYWKKYDEKKWNTYCIKTPISYEKLEVDHGYTGDYKELNLLKIKEVASFRGGEYLSKSYDPSELYKVKEWKCSHGHTFYASPFLVVRGGHWCYKCLLEGWSFSEQAKYNKHIAQVWYADHTEEEVILKSPYQFEL